MKKIIIVTLLAISIFSLIPILSAQENKNGSIHGSIFQDTNGDGLCQDGTPLAGVTVTAQLNGTSLKSVSTQDGSYFTNLPEQGGWAVDAFSANRQWGVVSAHPLQIEVSENGTLSQTGVSKDRNPITKTAISPATICAPCNPENT